MGHIARWAALGDTFVHCMFNEWNVVNGAPSTDTSAVGHVLSALSDVRATDGAR